MAATVWMRGRGAASSVRRQLAPGAPARTQHDTPFCRAHTSAPTRRLPQQPDWAALFRVHYDAKGAEATVLKIRKVRRANRLPLRGSGCAGAARGAPPRGRSGMEPNESSS